MMSVNVNGYLIGSTLSAPMTAPMKKGGIVRGVGWWPGSNSDPSGLVVYAQEDSAAPFVDRTFLATDYGAAHPIGTYTNVWPDPVYLGHVNAGDSPTHGPLFVYEIVTTGPTNTQPPEVIASPLAINTDPQYLYTHKGAEILGVAWTNLGSGSVPVLFVLQDGDEPSEVRTIRQINTTQDIGTLMQSVSEVHTIGTVRNPTSGAVQHYFWTLT